MGSTKYIRDRSNNELFQISIIKQKSYSLQHYIENIIEKVWIRLKVHPRRCGCTRINGCWWLSSSHWNSITNIIVFISWTIVISYYLPWNCFYLLRISISKLNYCTAVLKKTFHLSQIIFCSILRTVHFYFISIANGS